MNRSIVKHQGIINAHSLLESTQYYKTVTEKKRIVLHHTAGGSAKSSIDWWNAKPDHVATPFIIDRDGTIFETFDPKYWAYGLGLPNGTILEQECIQIEIANYGWLNKIDGKFYAGTKAIAPENVVTYQQPHRGQMYFEKYTDAQVNAVVFLIDYLANKFGINIPKDIKEFWHYQAIGSQKLLSHTTVRKDKSDIHPQPNLIKAIYDYAGCTAPVTE